jgi:Cu/Ag efflux pump CusA
VTALFGFPSLIAGLVLLLAGGSWFSGATTVGWILVIVSGVAILFGIVVFLVVGAAIARGNRAVRSTYPRRRF